MTIVSSPRNDSMRMQSVIFYFIHIYANLFTYCVCLTPTFSQDTHNKNVLYRWATLDIKCRKHSEDECEFKDP